MGVVRLRKLGIALGALLPAVLLAACAAARHHAPAGAERCAEPPPCGDNCRNIPYKPTTCWTTKYGPAKADILINTTLQSPNMLYCNGGTYALCAFSGPPTNPSGNQALPCVFHGDAATCTCQVYTSGAYFIDINAILNLGAYYETVKACGPDGRLCANIVNCGTDGLAAGCADQKAAPVCGYLQNQSPTHPAASLFPKADVISAFSFAMDGPYKLGSTPCSGEYAGCMTAPCTYKPGAKMPPSDGDPVQCECPVYNGTYQVGQNGQSCTIASPDSSRYIWSAANTVPNNDTP
jgi:hypothetical protein